MLPFTTNGKMLVLSICSVELKVSVMVLSSGVAAVEEAKTRAGSVSMLDDKSVSDE